MKIKALALLSFVYGAMFLTSAWAGPVGVQRSMSPDQRAVTLWQLQAKQEQVGRQLPEPPKGPALARYMDERARLQDLINRIQNGQPVAPDEIDQALQPTYR